jgi:hypothetical protein
MVTGSSSRWSSCSIAGAEDQIAGVGHDGGATGMDAIFGPEMEEAGEEGVDGDGGGKFGETGGEGDSECR